MDRKERKSQRTVENHTYEDFGEIGLLGGVNLVSLRVAGPGRSPIANNGFDTGATDGRDSRREEIRRSQHTAVSTFHQC